MKLAIIGFTAFPAGIGVAIAPGGQPSEILRRGGVVGWSREGTAVTYSSLQGHNRALESQKQLIHPGKKINYADKGGVLRSED